MAPLSVLIVDDEPRLRELLSRAVARMGCDVAAVESAEDAASELHKRRFNVVLLDLNLPGKSGIDFMDDLNRQWPDVQVIIVTGFGELSSAQKAVRHGLADYVTKPFDLGDIERALDRAIRRLQAKSGVESTSSGVASHAVHGSLEVMERKLIEATLARHQGNRTAAANELGITRRTLYTKIKQYGIEP